jgi:hypothetical protein
VSAVVALRPTGAAAGEAQVGGRAAADGEARAAMRTNIRLVPTDPPLPTRRLHAALPHRPFRTPPATAMLDPLTEHTDLLHEGR